MQVSCGPEGVAYKMCKLVSRRTLPYLIVVICFAPLCSPPSRIHAHLRYCARFLSTFHFSYTPPSPPALPLTLFILIFLLPLPFPTEVLMHLIEKVHRHHNNFYEKERSFIFPSRQHSSLPQFPLRLAHVLATTDVPQPPPGLLVKSSVDGCVDDSLL